MSESGLHLPTREDIRKVIDAGDDAASPAAAPAVDTQRKQVDDASRTDSPAAPHAQSAANEAMENNDA